jgi:hypothetical protein
MPPALFFVLAIGFAFEPFDCDLKIDLFAMISFPKNLLLRKIEKRQGF